MKFKFVLFLFLFSVRGYSVDVAFLSARDSDGKLIRLEEGGRYFHTAISFRGFWLHAHPVRGVEITKDLSDLGQVDLILSNSNFAEPSEEFVSTHLGKPFKMLSSWEDSSSFYCSKLVGCWLKSEPRAMNFEGDFWSGFENLPRGEKGLSPDDEFEQLIAIGFQPKDISCTISLQTADSRLSQEILDAKPRGI